MNAGKAVSAVCVLVGLLFAVPARASLFIGAEGKDVRPVRYRALVSHERGAATLLETVEVRNTNRRLVWMTPFPSRPDIAINDNVSLDDLERMTTVRAPFNYGVRRDPFGPSTATVLTRKLGRRKATPSGPSSSIQRTLWVVGSVVFSGDVQTSTITGLRVLPEALRRWMTDRQYPVSEDTKGALAGHLNRGWVIVAVELEDRAPNSTSPAHVPTALFRFPSEQAVLPLLRQARRPEIMPTFDVWVLADRRQEPSTYPVDWVYHPWRLDGPPTGRMAAVFSQSMSARDSLSQILGRQLNLALPPTPQLVRFRFKHGTEVWSEIPFRAAVSPAEIPGYGRRGSLIDLLLSVLLGLTPLMFTPESWFLLWLGRVSQERRAAGRPTWPNLWAFYAIVVAGYWLVALEGYGRLAALLPLIIGLTQLAWPNEPARDEFVRVQFKPKPKAKPSS